MAICAQCGNDYDKAFQLSIGGETLTFDSFECAIQKVAPRCAHCGCPIIGHGLEARGAMFCCDHCAEAKGVTTLRDRVA
jgi:hypothetical protein